MGDAERDGFKVGEDYRVTDSREVSTRGEFDARRTAAEAHSNFIRHRVGHLVANDSALTSWLKEATPDFGNLIYPISLGQGGIDPRVVSIRVMEPTSLYPNGYVTYMNVLGQEVDPFTGELCRPQTRTCTYHYRTDDGVTA